jgi:hypothetical protein
VKSANTGLRIKEEKVTHLILYIGQEDGMHQQKTRTRLNVTMSSPTHGNSRLPCVKGGTGQVCIPKIEKITEVN